MPAQSGHPVRAGCHGLGLPELSKGREYHSFLWGLLGRNGLVYTFLQLTRWSFFLDAREKEWPDLPASPLSAPRPPKACWEGEAGHGPWGSR